MPERLSEAVARKALPPVRGQTLLWDSEVKGFALRLTPGGAKSFILDYRAEGRQRRITLGAWPDWTVAAARQTAKDMKREVDLGHDPMGERQAQREAPTVLELWERYSIEHLPRKAVRSQADERVMWTKIILPRFGKMKVSLITHDDVDALHRDITEIRGTPVRANRIVEVLRKALNLAIRWKWLADNPASGVRRNPEEKRNRYLTRTEIAALARALNEHSETISANVIKLLILTGARRGEALGATWEMIDLENGVWTKPSASTKQRKLHRVPLSGPAVQLLTEMKAAAMAKATAAGTAPSAHVFPGPTGKPLTDIKRTWVSVCRKAGLGIDVPRADARGRPILDPEGKPKMTFQPNVRIHDIRHSFASILVSAGASLPLIGEMLGHSQVQTTARYAHLYDDPLRKAAETVGSFVLQPAAGTGEDRGEEQP
jgi:integrase